LGDFLYTLLSFSLASAIIVRLAPSEKSKRLLTFAAGIFLFVLVLKPIPTFVSKIDDFDASEYLESIRTELKDDGAYTDVLSESYETGIKTMICEKFSLDFLDVSVCADGFDFESLSATRINVILRNRSALADSYAISEYVYRSLGVLCRVEVMLNE
jgi:hypothetical protein